MLRTPLCDLLGIEVPILQAGMGIGSSAGLAVAVSNGGGLGSLGTWQRPLDQLRRDLAEIRAGTDRPYAINHLVADFDEVAFGLTLDARPPVISFALADPGDLVKRAHDRGSLVTLQVHTAQQAEEAAERGVDVVIAQGGEAGGYGGTVAGLALIPQVVDAVAPLPVVAAGGIADGRGLAAALALGASGVCMGTRFLTSVEALIPPAWRDTILAGASEDFVQVAFLNEAMPRPGAVGYGTRLRVRRNSFTDMWEPDRGEIDRDSSSALTEIVSAIREGRAHELLPVGGQSAGLIGEVLPVGEILRRVLSGAERALREAGGFVT